MKSNFILYVKDQRTSAAFYEKVLAQLPRLNVPGMTEFQINESSVLGLMPSAGILRLLENKIANPDEARGIPRAEIYLTVNNPAEYHRRALQEGAVELSPLLMRGWGDMAAYSLDPDGHVLVFASENFIGPVIQTERTTMKIPGPESAPLLLRYVSENRAHLAPWEPLRAENYFSIAFWESQLEQNLIAFKAGQAIKFVALTKSGDEVIGLCNFTNIARGVFQACNLGYSIAEKFQGQGIMAEIVSAGIEHAFAEAALHRIMANYVPENLRSRALLERLGFVEEGLAKSYLQINGEWRDHVLSSRINSFICKPVVKPGQV